MSAASTGPTTPSELLEIALDVARGAATIIRENRPDHPHIAGTKTSVTDVVTAMDQRVQDHVITELARLRPDDGFLGEEAGGTRSGSTGITWVVDPIDGTVNYLYGIPTYAVSVAAVEGVPGQGPWRTVAGVVIDLQRDVTYSAEVNGGSWRRQGNGEPSRLTTSGATEPHLALVGTGFGYASSRRVWQAAVLSRVLPRIRDIRRIGSAALDLCFVAEGLFDAFFERGLNPWDFAAAVLVITEAGGVVSGTNGEEPSHAMVMAAAPGLAAELFALIDEAVAEVGPETAAQPPPGPGAGARS